MRAYYNIFLTNSCDKSCAYCIVKEQINIGGDAIDKHALFQYLDRVRKGDLVEITGGEPTLVPWLEELVKFLDSKEVYIVLRTNGAKLFKNVYKWLVVFYNPHGDAVSDEIRGKLRPSDLILGETIPANFYDKKDLLGAGQTPLVKGENFQNVHPFTRSRHIGANAYVWDMLCRTHGEPLLRLDGKENVEKDLHNNGCPPCPSCHHITAPYSMIFRLGMEEQVKAACNKNEVSRVFDALGDQESVDIANAVYNYAEKGWYVGNFQNYLRFLGAMAYANSKINKHLSKDLYVLVRNDLKTFWPCILPNCRFRGLIVLDYDRRMTHLTTLPLLSIADYQMAQGQHTKCLIDSENHALYKTFISAGIPEGDILHTWEDKQYFDLEHIIPLPVEVFVDCGAFDGDTVDRYRRWAGDRAGTVYAFEPVKANREKMDRFKGDKNVVIVDRAVWDKSNEKLKLTVNGPESKAADNGSEEAVTVSLDDFFADSGKEPTFIKMDVEGSEMKALQGAVKTIKKHRPRLAVAVYHNHDDLWKIGGFILNTVENYKLYLRHYTSGHWETVLYAVPDEQIARKW